MVSKKQTDRWLSKRIDLQGVVIFKNEDLHSVGRDLEKNAATLEVGLFCDAIKF